MPSAQQQRNNVFGITNAGKPCKICIQKGDFCKKHLDQQTVTITVGKTNSGALCQDCIRLGALCNLHNHTATRAVLPPSRTSSTVIPEPTRSSSTMPATISSTSRPTPDSIPSAWVPPTVPKEEKKPCKELSLSKIFGVTLASEPCKRCMNQGKFCHDHVDQARQGVILLDDDAIKKLLVRKMQATRECKIYGIKKSNEPCKRCIKQGLFCFQHVSQQSRGSIDLTKFVDTKNMTPIVCGITKQNGRVCKHCLYDESGFCHMHQAQKQERAIVDAVSSGMTASPAIAPSKSRAYRVIRGTVMLLLVAMLSRAAWNARDDLPSVTMPQLMAPNVRFLAPPQYESESILVPAVAQTRRVADTVEETRQYLKEQFSALAHELEEKSLQGIDYTLQGLDRAIDLAQDGKNKAREGVIHLSEQLGVRAQSISAKVRNSTMLRELLGQGQAEEDAVPHSDGGFVLANHTSYEAALWKYISGSFLSRFQASEI